MQRRLCHFHFPSNTNLKKSCLSLNYPALEYPPHLLSRQACYLIAICICFAFSPRRSKCKNFRPSPIYPPDYPPGFHAPLSQTFGGKSNGGIISFGKLIFAEKQNKTIQNVKVTVLYLQFYGQSRLTPFPACLYVRELFYRLYQ